MATTTPNFGWAVPTSTDLVKDGAVAIETLGDAIDASLVDLKGGTTGQVLKKNTNTDMDFIWSSDAAGMTNPMTTTGDTIYSSSGSTPARLGIGSTGNVLTVSGGVPVWSAPAGGGKVLQVIQATTSTETAINTGTMTDTTITATITPSSASSKVLVLVDMNYYFDYAGVAKAIATQLVRGSTAIFTDGTGNSGTLTVIGATVIALGNRIPITYLDSPATTSATTYKVQANTTVTAGNFKAQSNSATSSIILLEIGA